MDTEKIANEIIEILKPSIQQIVKEEMESFYGDTIKAVVGLNKKISDESEKVIGAFHEMNAKKLIKNTVEETIKTIKEDAPTIVRGRTWKEDLIYATRVIPNASIAGYLPELTRENCEKYRDGVMSLSELFATIGYLNANEAKTSFYSFLTQLAIDSGGELNTQNNHIEGGYNNFKKYRKTINKRKNGL